MIPQIYSILNFIFVSGARSLQTQFKSMQSEEYDDELAGQKIIALQIAKTENLT